MIEPVWIAAAFSALAALLAALALVLPRRTPAGSADLLLVRDAVDDLSKSLELMRAMLAQDLRLGREEAELRGRSQREELGNLLGAGFGRFDDASRALREDLLRRLGELRKDGEDSGKTLIDGVTRQFQALAQGLTQSLAQSADHQKERLDGVAAEIRLHSQRGAEAHETMRQTLEGRLDILRQDNAAKLEEMRRTVDEKLQGTLEQRLNASFKLVSDQLEQVFKSVGEMQSLASGVGDLKRVLSNVKTRGTWAEVSLGALLDQVLTPDQYGCNIEVNPGSGERVEFAIKLPGGSDGGGPVWLPVDAKFPTEDYERLVEASERDDAPAVELALKGLEQRVRLEGATICQKYVCPPHSTDFAILFLPTEGLYAEVIRRPGLVDDLQRKCRIVVAGPTVLLAILSSLRMGFRTLAIQQRSSEVWRTLGAVKTEFSKYGDVLDKVKKKLAEASNTIDQVSVRKRQIDRKLSSVETMPEFEAGEILALEDNTLDREPFVQAAE